MGRSFASIRQRANGIAERWSRAVRALKRDDREHGRHLVALAKQHVSEGFVACNNPLEAVVFSILVELLKDREETGSEEGNNVDL
jgi:hypothetical protein